MLNTILYDIDITILRLIQNHRVLAFDQVLYFISIISSYVSVAIVLAILAVSLIKKSRPLMVIFFKMLAVLIIAALMILMLKNVMHRDRPFARYPDIVKMSDAGNSSFPSGHTLEVFAIATAFSILIPKRRFVIPLFIWACLVAYSRMALGVHYPSDIVFGMVIGSLIGWFIPWKFKERPDVNRTR